MALVAKSYVGLKQIGSEYIVNGRLYIKVELANGNVKQVRAYSQTEYKKYYPELAEKAVKAQKSFRTQKDALGFVNGYITIFKGDTYSCKDWFKENGAKYTKFWGWSFASDMEVPADLPANVEAIRLDWDMVGVDTELKNEDLIKAAVDSLKYDESPSEFQGTVGQRIEIEVQVDKIVHLDGYYGPSNLYSMHDDEGNVYTWITTSKKIHLEEDGYYRLRGTVKSHKIYHNRKQTILTRCSVINK